MDQEQVLTVFGRNVSQLPVITDLRNPCMKAEHWKTLEDIVGTELNVEELTLSILDKINIFSYGTEIQEVTNNKTKLSFP